MADEIDRLREKLIAGRVERKYLLKRLFQLIVSRLDQSDSMSAANLPFNVNTTTHLPDDFVTPYMARVFLGTEISKSTLPIPPAKSKGKRKIKKLTLEDINNVLMKGAKTKAKKSKSTVKVPIDPIELDASGKPVIPIVINELRVHSLGKIVHDKDSYHSESFIYPVGYCSSRSYPSTTAPAENINYMSTISEGNTEPKFEISLADAADVIFQASSPDKCVAKLNKVILEEIQKFPDKEISFIPLSGPEFFGISIPVIQNLIQNCPGAKKCTRYNWIRFEVKKKLPIPSKEDQRENNEKPVKVEDQQTVAGEPSHNESNVENSELQQATSSPLNNTTKQVDQSSDESDNDQLMIELDTS
ncbi:uncharacterized protein TRIADDRAFT_51312 [Trichoplax adhaerens]|uniref:Transforming growth factor beta regulator 1 n=1 Tax=Trichoplax adhaerens TaxID=10228 RepID=B3RIG7_TRIAD|nr:hypothetical protein TRIADDRAFT_51312 [Trichoplax adhaerens]EDV29231.1 hypothetical protein TRIADDRAFT_51312 [Trichoplax adhaerens]|eukprot:XP_002108433.1 hypothetical protein TRIADDRAFT_51312 [Trichoplax adhaerens]